MSCSVQWHSLPYHPSWVLEVYPSCGLSTPSSCCWALVVVGRSMGGIYPDQSAERTGCDHWPPISILRGGQLCRGSMVVLHMVCGCPLGVQVLWFPRLDGCGFFNCVVVKFPFNSISDGSEFWLFYNLVAILMWLWKAVSCIYLCCRLDQKSCISVFK